MPRIAVIGKTNIEKNVLCNILRAPFNSKNTKPSYNDSVDVFIKGHVNLQSDTEYKYDIYDVLAPNSDLPNAESGLSLYLKNLKELLDNVNSIIFVINSQNIND